MEEIELIKKITKGDENAFKLIYELYSKRIFNTVLHFLQNQSDAEDITQEVFIEIFRSISGFKHNSKFFTWIYRIAVTKSLDFIRRKKRKKRFALNIILEPDEIKSEDFNHPGIDIENKERALALFNAIRKLSENQRIAFTLNKIDGLEYKEIAEIMKISLSSVESLIFRAKEKLKKLLYSYYKDII
jgi:RNA polymerase sigma factor (sigma-70 family)